MALKPTVKDALNLGEAVLKGGGKFFSKLKPLGTAVTVISATMSVLTVAGWGITRLQEKRRRQQLRDRITKK